MSERNQENHDPRDPLPHPKDIIKGLARELGLNPQAEPQWGYDPSVERIFPDESPSILGRRQALHCLDLLYNNLEWRFGADKNDKARITTQNLIGTYELIREEQLIEFDPDYELPHVLGASKRHIAWLKEKKLYEETLDYNHELRVHQVIHDLLEETVYPEEIRTIQGIEEQIRQYVRHAYPPTPSSPTAPATEDHAQQGQWTLITAPYVEKRFRDYLNHLPIKLLPEEADTIQARDAASWCHEHLMDRVVEARETSKHLTPDEIREHYLWYRNVGQHEQNEKHPDEGLKPTDFTMENLLGRTKRRLLYWHYIKDQQPEWQQNYWDTLTLYNLLDQLISQ